MYYLFYARARARAHEGSCVRVDSRYALPNVEDDRREDRVNPLFLGNVADDKRASDKAPERARFEERFLDSSYEKKRERERKQIEKESTRIARIRSHKQRVRT